MITQYYDCMRDIGANSKATTVFVPHNPSSVSDLSQQLRNGILQGAPDRASPRPIRLLLSPRCIRPDARHALFAGRAGVV